MKKTMVNLCLLSLFLVACKKETNTPSVTSNLNTNPTTTITYDNAGNCEELESVYRTELSKLSTNNKDNSLITEVDSLIRLYNFNANRIGCIKLITPGEKFNNLIDCGDIYESYTQGYNQIQDDFSLNEDEKIILLEVIELKYQQAISRSNCIGSTPNL